MPIYEYQCRECGHRFETMQSFSDAPLTDCPACTKQQALKKLLSAPAFRLKGGGWYETDFKSNNKRNIAGGSDAASDSSSAGETKAEPAKSDAASATPAASTNASKSDSASS